MTPEQFERLKNRLACPECKNSLKFDDDGGQCEKCNTSYPQKDGKIYFISPEKQNDELDMMKGYLKNRFGPLYHKFLKPAFSPSYPFNFGRYLLANTDPKTNIVIDLGSGNNKIHPDIFSLDIMDYQFVDIVCDMRRLPFRDGSIDAIGTNSVLEHVPDITRVLDQIELVTCPGGTGMHVIPFIYPFHASPDDFQRLTHVGAAKMFERWQPEQQFAVAGPFTLFNVVIIEILSIIMSFGNARIRAIIYLALSVILSPIKYLDLPFIRRKVFLSIAPLILTHLRKPTGSCTAEQQSDFKPSSSY